MHRSRFLYSLIALPALITGLMAQIPKGPLEIRQDLTTYNLSSRQGVPISSVANTPPGSNGKVPPLGSQIPPLPSGDPTPRQFQGAMMFGAGVRPVALKEANLTPFVLNGKTLPAGAFTAFPVGSTTSVLGFIQQAFDENPNTSYLNYFKAGSGVTIDSGGSFLANGLILYTSAENPDRDPSAYELLGSNDNQAYISIQKGTLNAPLGRLAAYDPIKIPDGSVYRYFRLVFTSVRRATADGCQVSEIRLSVRVGSTAPVPTNLLDTNKSLAANAVNANLPRVGGSTPTLILLRARVGSPVLNRGPNYLFGSIIPVPDTDVSGNLLPPNIRKEDYWMAEPYTTNNHSSGIYYWSPNARVVFATKAGVVNIQWRKLAGSTQKPASPIESIQEGGMWYSIYNQRLVVSGSLVKPAQSIFWTQGDFTKIGKPVLVPANRVSEVKVVYNDVVPERVEHEYVGSSRIANTNILEETRTLWFDKTLSQILAYNKEGRVFVELLGDSNPDGISRKHLGFEIVEILQRPTPQDINIDLGERMPAYSDPTRDDSKLYPEPVEQLGMKFIETVTVNGNKPPVLYAVRETRNLNDVLVYWMESGVQGLMWPRLYSRYNMQWPTDVAKYNHYIRPLVNDENEAIKTAVQMSASNVPLILYQDPLDQERAKLTADLKFYTYLIPQYPAHRTLIRYNAEKDVVFERVYSWLDANLKSTNWASSVVTNLTAWNKETKTINFNDPMNAPRVVNEVVNVGQRIQAPSGEYGSLNSQSYFAGHIRSEFGTSYHPGAYQDPFVVGFEDANKGSIIPVNAIPGKNNLEIWWFRKNENLVRRGLEPTQWPSVIGRYTIQYPQSPREIVLASNAGTGGLESLEAKGSIYYQNDPKLTGYNPNEEHALMIGGQGYALRDDLNITTGTGFSSLPFVLIDYIAADGRPSMAVFKVLREKPSTGLLFDYVVEAGTILQAPMPLPLLPAPTEGEGVAFVNYNTEPEVSLGQGDLPLNWNESRDSNGAFKHYKKFTYRDRKQAFWVYRGLHKEPGLLGGTYNSTTKSFDALPNAVAIAGRPFKYYIHSSRRVEGLVLKTTPGANSLPAWIKQDADFRGIFLAGVPPDAASAPIRYSVDLIDLGLLETNKLTLSLEVKTSGTESTQLPLTVTSQSSDGTSIDYVGRPPYLADRATDKNSFSMRFYYKTQEGFAWPGVAESVPVGSIVPYLRPLGSTAGTYVGKPASKDTVSLNITYRPAWPAIPAQLQPGQTLATPVNGLPAMRGQTSAEILYQQSIATNITKADPSVVLIDPTRQKIARLDSDNVKLDALPSGVLTESYQGLIYFPKLPPHLAKRVYFDPNIGPSGSLVLKGEFKNEAVGEKYLQLNVLRGVEDRQDLKYVLDLCPSAPADEKGKWDALVNNLSTTLQTFYENPNRPGEFIPNPVLDVAVGVGGVCEIKNDDTAVDSYAVSASGPGYGFVSVIVGNGRAFTPVGEPVTVHVFRMGGSLWPGELKVTPSENPLNELLTVQHTPDLGGRYDQFEYEWRIAAPVDGAPPPMDPNMTQWQLLKAGTAIPRYTLGGAGIQVLSDNYITMRYRSTLTSDPVIGKWSSWTEPQLAEGWIKRVLAGINPFQQRVKDLYNNAVNTDVSVLTQSGKRWEGAISLNLKNINNYGLVEIYETVLRRGRMLSIDSGINYGPANDALLLVAGYLNDLYSLLGDEARADAANPTIATGTANSADGSVATARFSFAGQMASLLEEELGLLRGRDDFMQPGVQTAPVYNRLFWNYTRGINSGEVIYSENYNIKDLNDDGVIDASDAAKAYPQGHGDAYGHYLTALKGYYGLLINRSFDWVPRSEAVTILGKAVQVDYMDERKFAAASQAISSTGVDIMKLVFRQAYRSGDIKGWDRFAETRSNTNRAVNTVRYWGLDHWASRVGQSSYLNWVVGNSLLPEVDPDPAHEGIQKIDRTTVPELGQLPLSYSEAQKLLDNAEAGLTPLGLPKGSVAFDMNPNLVTGLGAKTHFEQVYDNAVTTLKNAAAAFEDARTMSTAIRTETDSLEVLKASIADGEKASTTKLIELYGTPYSDDIGPGRTYEQGYLGPDLVHFTYVDNPELQLPEEVVPVSGEFEIEIPGVSKVWDDSDWHTGSINLDSYAQNAQFNKLTTIKVNIGSAGYSSKPSTWSGQRSSPGQIQQAISEVIASHSRLRMAVLDVDGQSQDFRKASELFRANWQTQNEIVSKEKDLLIANQTIQSVLFANDLYMSISEQIKEDIKGTAQVVKGAFPASLIAGLAAGGDLTSAGRSAVEAAGFAVVKVYEAWEIARLVVVKALEFATQSADQWEQFNYIAPRERLMELRQSLADLSLQVQDVQDSLLTVNQRLREYQDAKMKYRALVAQGERLQSDRQAFRIRASAAIQGYRTRDVAFRLFRNEKLDRYSALLDLASRYSFLAANAYDYETGLLGNKDGQSFIDRIIQARAIGVVKDGQPQFTGSKVGDAGLSGALAEMQSDWSVLKGRLGFNNPDSYGTTASLRTENYRILPGTDGDANWKDVLERGRMDNLLTDPDVRRLCMQIDRGNGLAVPGIVLEFATTISDGNNLFGQPLAAGDHTYNSSSYATKIFAAGIALPGYKGMDVPAPNSSAVSSTGSVSPADPNLAFLDSSALSATPYVYLIPVGVDSMRSPPLGDESAIRTWSVQDVTIPIPFNIGSSDFSTKKLWQSADSLSEPLFSIRKHQAFRPVPTAEVFTPNIYNGIGGLSRSQFTNSRLVGRSVWNSRWKIVIPGHTLLNDPTEGLNRFIQSVKDIKLHFVTYSYSGN